MKLKIVLLLLIAIMSGKVCAQETANKPVDKKSKQSSQPQEIKMLKIGDQAPNFTAKTPKNVSTSLSSLRGKYVLVDFWASWCGPCRKENPTLIKAYKKFKGKNFEIIAVSLDDDKGKWVNAIKTDKLPWIQVSDLKGLKSPIIRQYGITGIPMNFLLDTKGVIIAMGLHNEELEQKLHDILK